MGVWHSREVWQKYPGCVLQPAPLMSGVQQLQRSPQLWPRLPSKTPLQPPKSLHLQLRVRIPFLILPICLRFLCRPPDTMISGPHE